MTEILKRVILPAEAHAEIANAPKAFYAEKIAVGLIEQRIDPLQKYILVEDAFPWVRRVAEAAASPNAGKVTEAEVEAFMLAIETAGCPGREGPYGLYDYSAYPGDTPPHVVRDLRSLSSPTYGADVFASHDKEKARAEYERLTRLHKGRAALASLGLEVGE